MTTTTPAPARTTRSGGAVARRTGEFRALTGLRIVAAAWVVAFHFHFTPLDGVATAARAFGPLVSAGALGVDLFFVLSGFVIAHTYLDRLGPALRVAATARFFWARAVRIWPAYAVVLHVSGLWVVARLVLRVFFSFGGTLMSALLPARVIDPSPGGLCPGFAGLALSDGSLRDP